MILVNSLLIHSGTLYVAGSGYVFAPKNIAGYSTTYAASYSIQWDSNDILFTLKDIPYLLYGNLPSRPGTPISGLRYNNHFNNLDFFYVTYIQNTYEYIQVAAITINSTGHFVNGTQTYVGCHYPTTKSEGCITPQLSNPYYNPSGPYYTLNNYINTKNIPYFSTPYVYLTFPLIPLEEDVFLSADGKAVWFDVPNLNLYEWNTIPDYSKKFIYINYLILSNF